MTEWNERIKEAQEAACNDSLTKSESLTGKGVAAMLTRVLHYLKEPKSRHLACGCVLCICENKDQCLGCGAKYCSEKYCVVRQSHVKHPNGRMWKINDRPGASAGHDKLEPHLYTTWCDQVGCRPVSPAEVFRPGAVIQWTKDDILIQGPILHARGDGTLSINLDGFMYWTFQKQCTLVKLALEARK